MPKIIKDGRIYGASPGSLSDLADTSIASPTNNEALVWNQSTHKWENGTVSTVGSLNDLTDVTINTPLNRQELVYNDSLEVFQNKTTRVELTTAQYNQLVEDDHVLPNVDYYITDAPSMSGSSRDLSYDGGTDSVYDVVEEVKGDVAGKQDALTVTTGTVTYETTNVQGSTSHLNWFKYGRVVIAHLEFTPLSGKIASGNIICTGLPLPYPVNNCFGDNKQQFTVDNTGALKYYFPTDTTTLNRWDLNITYISAS